MFSKVQSTSLQKVCKDPPESWIVCRYCSRKIRQPRFIYYWQLPVAMVKYMVKYIVQYRIWYNAQLLKRTSKSRNYMTESIWFKPKPVTEVPLKHTKWSGILKIFLRFFFSFRTKFFWALVISRFFQIGTWVYPVR